MTESFPVEAFPSSPEEAAAEATPFGALTLWCRQLEQRQAEHRLRMKSEGSWKPTATPASELGYRCVRRIVYGRVVPWARRPLDAGLASIFVEGDKHELDVLNEIEQGLGVRIRNRSTPFRDPKFDISGRIDFEVYVLGVGWVPTEVKGLSWVPGDEEIEGADLAESSIDLHRRYLGQLETYLLLPGVEKEFGIFIWKSKMTGRWKVIPVRLDYQRGEELLSRAEKVRDAVRAWKTAMGERWDSQTPPQDDPEAMQSFTAAVMLAEQTLPERIRDRSECGRCPFFERCLPSQADVDPALLVTDDSLLVDLQLHETRRPQASEYDKVHRLLRERFVNTKGTTFLLGDYVVSKSLVGKAIHVKIRRAPGASPVVDAATRLPLLEESLRVCVDVLADAQPLIGHPLKTPEDLEAQIAMRNRMAAAVVNAPLTPKGEGR